ncbi:MAG: beta-ribofuranosylaminobenzene 5'-phosphate synthase family protein [Candidatus Hecatellaceae archaeon]
MKVKIETPSRLHFILLDLHGSLGRVDGGAGVALENPGWTVEVEPFQQGLEIESCLEAEKGEVESIALKFLGHYGLKPAFKIKVLRGIPRHVGLGSGTQLTLAVAYALAKASSLNVNPRELAGLMGRGGTSGIGVAAFEAGGIIVDGGHSFGPGKQKQSFLPSHYSPAPPPPVLARYMPPKEWFWVVAVPPGGRGAHGLQEAEFFKSQCPIPESEVEKASRIVLLKLMPALAEASIAEVGEALNMLQRVAFKRLEVELAGTASKRLMELMVGQGAYGAGLSSFGPAVYGLVEGHQQAENLEKALREFFQEQSVEGMVLKARTSLSGARVLLNP